MRRTDAGFHWFTFLVTFLILAGCAATRIARIELPELAERGEKPVLIRVNILDSVNRVTISSKEPCRISMGGKVATSPAGKEWLIKLVNGEKVIETVGSRKSVVKDPRFPLVFSQKVKGGLVTVNGLPYRGAVKVNRTGRDKLLVINELPLEDYLRSVVPSEIGGIGSESIEAAKAQAVAARTYAVSSLGKHSALGYDLVSTTNDQVYSGAIRESAVTDRAVAETKGIIAVYRGEPIRAVYHSTCGGHTCSNEDSWLGGPTDYLRARRDFATSIFGQHEPFCKDSPMFRWTRSWNKQEFEQMVMTNLRSILGRSPKGDLVSIKVIKRDKFDRGTAVQVNTTAKNYRVDKGRIRSLFRDPKKGWVLLPSTNFELKHNGSQYTMYGKGWGHGVGMCQWGAIGMSRKGYTYDKILTHYYRGIGLAKAY